MHTKKHCSPFKKSLSYSCLDEKLLQEIRKGLNKIKGIKINSKLKGKKLHTEISKIMKNKFKCDNEACWLNIRKLMSNLSGKSAKLVKDHFRPMMPKEIVEHYSNWLSNFDIDKVLEQYHNDLPEFYYYGAVPIDFRKCSVSNLCNFNLSDHINRGEHKIGIVFNTDESHEDGKHWISMYADINGLNLNGQPGIYYFDSFGNAPPQEVKDLIDIFHDHGKKHDKKFVVTTNDRSHQKNNFSCGFYCMHFLENMIKGKQFEHYINDSLNDKKMIEYRNHCFLHPKEIKTR